MWKFFTQHIWSPTILACLNIITFTPNHGPVQTTVTITGGGFTGTTKVTFNGYTAAVFTVNSDTQITATVPSGATGTGPITITTPAGGKATSSTNFAIQ